MSSQAGQHSSEAAIRSGHGPSDAKALNQAGLQALAVGDSVLARERFEAAIACDADADALWLNLATCCRSMGDDKAEENALEQVLLLNRKSLAGWIRQAELKQRLGNVEDALRAWRNAFELLPVNHQDNSVVQASLDQGRRFLAERSASLSSIIAEALGDEREDEDGRKATWRLRSGIAAMFGSRKIHSNECAGFHFPFLPAEEFFARRHFPWLRVLEAATDEIRREFLALYDGADLGSFRPYVRMEPGTPQNIWSALDGSDDWSTAFLWEYGETHDANLSRCPVTCKTLDELPLARIAGRGPSAFFSILRPGARIPPHTGVTNVRAIVHLPLIVPPGCRFRVGGETREWVEGQAFIFDDTIVHEAVNPSEAPRVVLICDVWNPWLTSAEIAGVQAMFSAIEEGDQG